MKQGVLNLFHSNRLSAPGRRGRRCVACRRAFATATKSDSEPRAKRAAGPRERAVPLPDFPLRLRRGSACPRSYAEPHPLQRRHALQPLTPAVVLKNARLPARGSERALQRLRNRNQIGFGAASEAGRRPARANGPTAAASHFGRAGKRKQPGRTAHPGRRSCELPPPGARLRTRAPQRGGSGRPLLPCATERDCARSCKRTVLGQGTFGNRDPGRKKVERETGLEPATNGLEGRDSTLELLPLASVAFAAIPILEPAANAGQRPPYCAPRLSSITFTVWNRIYRSSEKPRFFR